MKTSKEELFVGMFVLVGLVLLAGLIVFFGQLTERLNPQRYQVCAIFDNLHAMAPGTPVRHLGIDVGLLEETGFTTKHDQVKLVLGITEDHNIPADAILSVRQAGILGDYFLEFSGGNPDDGLLSKDGSAVVHGEPMVSVEEVAMHLVQFAGKLQESLDVINKSVPELLDNLNAILGDEEFQANLKATVAEAPETVRSIKKAADRTDDIAKDVQQMVKTTSERVEQASDEVKTTLAAIKKAAENFDGQISHQGKNLDEITQMLVKDADRVNDVLTSVQEILTHINKGEGAVGRVLKDDKLHVELIDTIKQLNDALKEMSKAAESVRKRWGS